MTGQEVYEVLAAKGVQHLHHANSVMTSSSFFQLGGLASRALVEQQGLPQSNQITDDIDRAYGIFSDVFVDTVDIHRRRGDRNKYGPVLFVLDVRVLLALPIGSQVLVTRLNPSKWPKQTQTDAQRYFLTQAELAQGIGVGNFDHMLVLRCPGGLLPLPGYLQQIVLDEPRLAYPQTGPEFGAASAAFTAAVQAAGLQAGVQRRQCEPGCDCVQSYAENTTRIPYFFRLP